MLNGERFDLWYVENTDFAYESRIPDNILEGQKAVVRLNYP